MTHPLKGHRGDVSQKVLIWCLPGILLHAENIESKNRDIKKEKVFGLIVIGMYFIPNPKCSDIDKIRNKANPRTQDE